MRKETKVTSELKLCTDNKRTHFKKTTKEDYSQIDIFKLGSFQAKYILELKR